MEPFLTPTTVKEFNLNTSSFTDEKQLNSTNQIHSNEIQSKNKTINIHTAIQVILAQEKHKVARQEVTEGSPGKELTYQNTQDLIILYCCLSIKLYGF